MTKILAYVLLMILSFSVVVVTPSVFSLGNEDVTASIDDVNDDDIDGVGDDLEVEVEDFPEDATVEIWLGNEKLGTLKVDDGGDGTKTFEIPEIPGGEILVLAVAKSERVSASTTVDIESRLELKSNGDVIDDTNDEDSERYVENGQRIVVVGTGFGALDDITLEDDGTGTSINIVGEGMVNSVSIGSLTDDAITTNGDGSFKLVYTADIDSDDVETGDEISLTAEPDRESSLDTNADYLALAGVDIDVSLADLIIEKGDEITFDVDDISPLAESVEYQILVDGSTQSLEIDGDSVNTFTDADDDEEITFDSPSKTGPHKLGVIIKGGNEVLDSTLILVSEEDGSAEIAVVSTNDDFDEPTGETINTVTVGQKVIVVLYDFEEDEEVSVSMSTSNGQQDVQADFDLDSIGAGEIEFTIPSSAGGTYSIWAENDDRESGDEIIFLVKVGPSITITDVDGGSVDGDGAVAEGPIKSTVTMDLKGLAPNTAYVVTFDGTAVEDSIFTTDEDGEEEDYQFDVPSVSDSTVPYEISVALASSSNSPLKIYDNKGEENYPTYEIESQIDFSDEDYVADALVVFSWDSENENNDTLETITIELDGTPILSGQINETEFTGVSNGASIEWDNNGFINGTFVMPNGSPNTVVEVTITLGSTETSGTVERKSGSGSLTTSDGNEDTLDSLVSKTDEISDTLDNEIKDLKEELAAIKETTDFIGFITILAVAEAEEKAAGEEKELEEVKKFEGDLDKTLKSITNIEKKLASLESSTSSGIDSALKKSVSDLKEEVQTSAGKTASSISGVEASVDNLKTSLQSLEDKMSGTTAQASTSDLGLGDLSNTVLILLIVSLTQLVLLGTALVLILRRTS